MSGGLAARYARLVHDKMGWWGSFPVSQQRRVGDYFLFGKDGKTKYLGCRQHGAALPSAPA